VTALLGEAPGAGMQPTSPQPSLTTMSDAQTARAIQILTTDSVARPGPAVPVWRGNSSLTSIFPLNSLVRGEPRVTLLVMVRPDEAAFIQRVRFPHRQGLASQRESSLALCKVTSMAKRRQSDRQAPTQVKRLSPVT
jgi:hypothetical protein